MLTVFLLDVDNTLLDNDRLIDDLMNHLAVDFGVACRDRYRAILEQLRAELGYVDYLGALQRFRLTDINNPRLMMISRFLIDYRSLAGSSTTSRADLTRTTTRA